MATNKRQRVVAASAAIFFLVASLATSIAVIYTLATQKKSDSSNNQQQANNQQQQQQDDSRSKLVGTKLQNYTPTDQPVTDLQSTDTKVGDGAEAKADSTLTVLYTGALAKDGTIFDASGNTPVDLSLAQVIKGWQQGIPGMKVGGTRRLVIPASLAYGSASPSSAIPPNSDLVFDVTLVAVK